MHNGNCGNFRMIYLLKILFFFRFRYGYSIYFCNGIKTIDTGVPAIRLELQENVQMMMVQIYREIRGHTDDRH